MGLKLSVICLTYNHEKFIRQALDAFVMQKTNFPFEVIIHDDASTDGTPQIIKEYADKYPDLIKPIYQKENIWQKGVSSREYIYPQIKGEYVALCEGDDYWTDPLKLQKQVDFLDAHPEFNVCFHPVKVIWEDNRAPESIFPKPKFRFNKKTLTLQDLLKRNFIQTNSVMYRWHDISNEWPTVSFMPGDYMMHLLQTGTGKIGFLPEVMAVYRRNSSGVWTGAMESDKWFNKCAIPHLRFYQEVENRFHVDKTADKIYLLQKTLNSFLKNKKFKEIEQIATEFPDLWNKFIFFEDSKYLKKKIRHLIRKIYFLAICVVVLLILFLLKWKCL